MVAVQVVVVEVVVVEVVGLIDVILDIKQKQK